MDTMTKGSSSIAMLILRFEGGDEVRTYSVSFYHIGRPQPRPHREDGDNLASGERIMPTSSKSFGYVHSSPQALVKLEDTPSSSFKPKPSDC